MYHTISVLITDSVYSYNTIYCWSVLYTHYGQNLVAEIKLQFIAIYMYTDVDRTVADPGKMKGGFQLTSAQCEIFWDYTHFWSHVTRENPILSQGRPIIDLRIIIASSS